MQRRIAGVEEPPSSRRICEATLREQRAEMSVQARGESR